MLDDLLRIVLELHPPSLRVQLLNSAANVRPESMLRPYQAYIADKIVDLPAVLMSVEMSLGKTGATLTAVRRLLDAGTIKRVLVVAPLEVAKNTWPDEIAVWEHTRDLDFTVLIGDPTKREDKARDASRIHIINRELITWLVEFWGEAWPYDMVVWDESSRFKAGKKRSAGSKKPDPKTGKKRPPKLSEFGAICSIRKFVKRIVLLTGTPAPNGLHDLWGQAYVLDFGHRLGATMHAFEGRWFDKGYMGWDMTPRPHAEGEIMGLLKDVMIGLRAEDYIALPPKVMSKVFVDLTPAQMKEYKRFEKTLITETYDVEAVSKGVLTNKLLQFCIAEGTEVLTGSGWCPIEEVSSSDVIWDGVAWVSCEGSVFNGIKGVVSCYGVDMTIDHKVLTEVGWREARDVIYGNAGERLDRAEVRLPDGHVAARNIDGCDEEGHLGLPMRLRQDGDPREPKPSVETSTQPEVVRVQAWRSNFGGARRPHDDRQPTLGDLATDEEPLPKPQVERLPELRWARDRHAGRLVPGLQSLLARCAGRLRRSPHDRPPGQQRELQQGQPPLGHYAHPVLEQAQHDICRNSVGPNDLAGGCREIGDEVHHDTPSKLEGRERGDAHSTRFGKQVGVYDLVNCGPRNRFVVRGSDGPLIVHNCNGALYRPIEGTYPVERETVHIHDAKIDALERIIEEAAGQNILVAYSFKFDLDRIKKRFPKAVVFDDDPDFVKNWNDGKTQLGLAHPASIGHGLNLQHGGHIQVWFGLTWSLELYMQFNQRLARPGQANDRVFIYHILARGTNDETVYEAMNIKGATQNQITQSVRVRLLGGD